MLNLLSATECAKRLLLDNVGFNDMIYSPADWTAVRQAGQVPGELLGSDGERKVGKVEVCRCCCRGPTLGHVPGTCKEFHIASCRSTYATWGDPEMSDVGFLPSGTFLL